MKSGTAARHRDTTANPERWLDVVIEVKHHGLGAAGVPRHPQFLRRRDARDAEAPVQRTVKEVRMSAPSPRNYGAMKDEKLLRVMQELETGGDAAERCKAKGLDPRRRSGARSPDRRQPRAGLQPGGVSAALAPAPVETSRQPMGWREVGERASRSTTTRPARCCTARCPSGSAVAVRSRPVSSAGWRTTSAATGACPATTANRAGASRRRTSALSVVPGDFSP